MRLKSEKRVTFDHSNTIVPSPSSSVVSKNSSDL